MRSFGFLLIPGFSLVALSCSIDVLRAANLETKNDEFRWTLLGDDCSSVSSSSNIKLDCEPISKSSLFDVVVVCGGERSHDFRSKRVEHWLQRSARSGSWIGSVSDGAYIVARAGLFDHHRSTIHWKCQSAYRETFPLLDVRMSIMEIDQNRFSCAGGTASIDLMLNFVAEKLGLEVTGRIADNYFHDTIRNDGQLQHTTSAFRFALHNKSLCDALILMENALEQPIAIIDIAKKLNISSRQLNRIFKSGLNTSPSKHYREMRLLRASSLLQQTNLPVSEIALCCGFQSSSCFSKHFKQKFGETPRAHRGGLKQIDLS